MESKDLYGKAIVDYFNHLKTHKNHGNIENIITSTHISSDDELPLDYLFRRFEDMPLIEQKALNLCRGKVLDVGCGAGGHSLWLQKKGHDLKAIDISPGAVEVAKKRGVKNVELLDILDERDTFDSIILLMNGTGIFQKFNDVEKYLLHLKTLLNADGQILIDSSDIIYMYDDIERKEFSGDRYYGELDYFISYKNDIEKPITWLYLDFESLKTACQNTGLTCEKAVDGAHYDYLARLTIS